MLGEPTLPRRKTESLVGSQGRHTWANDPQIVRKWQTIFVLHRQTAFLERLQEKLPPGSTEPFRPELLSSPPACYLSYFGKEFIHRPNDPEDRRREMAGPQGPL